MSLATCVISFWRKGHRRLGAHPYTRPHSHSPSLLTHAHVKALTLLLTDRLMLQLQWLSADLAAIDRKRTPWVVVGMHGPW